MNQFVSHASMGFALAGTGAAVASTGGSHSAAWIYLFWIALFGCYFYARPLAMVYVGIAIVIQALPLLYDSQSLHDGLLPQLIVAGTGYIAVGGIVSTGKRMVDGLRLRAETLAAEQTALQRAASAVIRGEEAERIFEIVSADLASLLGCALVSISRFEGDLSAKVLGSWSDATVTGFVRGETLAFNPDGGFARVLQTRSVARNDNSLRDRWPGPDVALYASKASGRNQVTLYDAEVAEALDAKAREAWFERSQALSGLRALARAIDAKGPATSEHSERVAQFAGLLAQAGGWPDERVARLREAALVHDVGKLAVPDTLLTKPGPLTERERLQMSEHVELSARIVGSILSEEQVGWIRGHHERPDGGGYPAGLVEHEIADGAALLALADAWDVMIAGRTYSRTKTVDEAYQECVELAGRQFSRAAVAALEKLGASGVLQLSDPAAADARSAVAR